MHSNIRRIDLVFSAEEDTTMTLSDLLRTNVSTMAAILSAMALVALIELAIPLHRRGPAHRAHLGPNLGLTAITFATNIFLNGALMVLLAWLEARGLGILRWMSLGALPAAILAVLALDFSFYVAHVAMHKVPAFWRAHRVHHSDPVVDVTTTIRQHPLEGVIRYGFMALFASVFGVSLGAFVVYRAWSALNGLLEHANIKVPRWLDQALALVTTWPNMHKVHHSRALRETDSNYGNIFSWFDRLFSTYTPSWRGEAVVDCGLDGFDDPRSQRLGALLSLPFRPGAPSPAPLSSDPSAARLESKA
jgi:sterol desaturase/sphingolipid hydroxylase (fatty acid hydroxylase superfamily)